MSAAGPTPVAGLPAAAVPVPAQVRGAVGNHDEVAGARRDLLLAARATVRLHGLVRLDAAHLDVVVVEDRHRRRLPGQPWTAHATSAATITSAATTMT